MADVFALVTDSMERNYYPLKITSQIESIIKNTKDKGDKCEKKILDGISRAFYHLLYSSERLGVKKTRSKSN